MPPQPTTDAEYSRPFTKVPGTEPLPGYVLLEPLGRGGFGEVWKCEAPGGLHKAIKFVPGEGADDGQGERRLAQEYEAFQQIKAILHPFLLTLERVEVVDGELVMVMELADRQLHDRFRECRNCGLPGIPRDELMAYFADAAEALDMIAGKFGLQHLDVKPANLFLVAGHVKVGDYGLLASLDPEHAGSRSRGLTPKYVAPEALRGEPSHRSDQYSLALVYQELLTGTFPYAGRGAQQIMVQHATAAPDVSPLPPCDRPIVLRALAKDPAARFGSCLGFVQALLAAASATSLPAAAIDVRRARVERSRAEVELELPMAEALDADDGNQSTAHHRVSSEITHNSTLPGVSPNTTTTKPPSAASKLVAPGGVRTPPPLSHGRPPSLDYLEAAPRPERPPAAVVLNPVKSVVSVARLTGQAREERLIPADDMIRAVVACAAAGGHVPQAAGDLARRPDGTLECRFPSTVPAAVVPMKLTALAERWGVSLEQPDPACLVLRRTAGGGGFWNALSKKKPSGYEVQVALPPPGRAICEVVVTGGVFGKPERDVVVRAHDELPRIIDEVRRELNNVQDRRKHPRVAADLAVTVYPIHSDGGIGNPVAGRCRDVSAGGVSLHLPAPAGTKYFFVAFDDVAAVSRQAVLVRTVRLQTGEAECYCGGMFRTDL